MSKFKEVPPAEILKQLDFFTSNIPPKSLGIQNDLRKSISVALKSCLFSRDHIASYVSELVGYRVSRSMLDNYADVSHIKHRIPAELIPALCVVTRDYTPLRIQVETAGGVFIGTSRSSDSKTYSNPKGTSTIRERRK